MSTIYPVPDFSGARRHVFPSVPSHRLLAGLSCSLGVLMASQALAQTADMSGTSRQSASPATTRQTLPTISVHDRRQDPNGLLRMDTANSTGSRLGLTERETPASVTVIDRETIEARGARTTHDVLNELPGVHASATHGDVNVTQRGFRGASINQVYNGINLQYSIATQPVDAWIYERVEDIGGPSSFLYGAGGVGATINYITKTAQRHDISEVQLGAGTRRYRQAAFGLNRRIAGDGSGQKDHYVRIDANHERGGQWVDDNRGHSSQIVTSLLSDLGGGFTHTLAYEYQHERDYRPYWGTPVAQPTEGRQSVLERLRHKNYNSADGLYMQRVQWLRSIADWKLSDALSVKNTFYGYDAVRDYRNVEEYALDSTNTQVNRTSALLQRHDHRVFGDRIDATLHSTIAGHRSDWSFGVDVSFNRQTTYPTYASDDWESAVDPDHFITEYFYDLPGMVSTYVPKNRHRVNNLAFYLENRTDLTPTLKLLTGLRHERIKLHFSSLDPEEEVKRDGRRSYHPTTGRIGLAWDISPQAMVYAQYATAADPAAGNLASTYYSQILANDRLTSGRMLELGTKLSFWGNRGSATLSVYDISRRNIATNDPRDRRVTYLIGRQDARGVEAKLGLQLTPAWSMQANVGYVDAEYKQFYRRGESLAGKTPSNVPRTVTNLWTSYALTPELKLQAGARHVTRLYGNENDTIWWPSYTVADVGFEYRFSPTVTLSGFVNNVTDRLYATESQPDMVVLGDPRTAWLTVKVAF